MIIDILQAIAAQSDCYKAAAPLTPSGIVVHSTGANNPNLKRYVNSPAELGENKYQNYWGTGTKQDTDGIPHAAVGLDKNGSVRIAQVLPFNIRCWSAGRGSKGSYNTSHIQFEICEDALTNKGYFEDAFNLAAQFCAYLMTLYPAIKLENIVSHSEAHALGYASNHGDPENWLSRFGKDMNWFRNIVSSYLNTSDNTSDSKVYRVQVGAFSTRENAQNFANQLAAKGLSGIVFETQN